METFDLGGEKIKNKGDISRRDILKSGSAFLTFPVSNLDANDSIHRIGFKEKYGKFISGQINEIKTIIQKKEYHRILSNPYLAYSLQCLQTYLDKVSDLKNQHDVSEIVTGSFAPLITPEFRAQAIRFFTEQSKKQEQEKNKKISSKKVLPLKQFNFGRGKNHEVAIDLFVKELSPIFAMQSGLVILAENGWRGDDESSTSSTAGGNAVVIFNYVTKEFFRYAHCHEVVVKPGQLVIEGDTLGTVGHTGKNAALPGHGQHLHLEIHPYLSDKNTNGIVLDRELREILESLKSVRK